MHRICGSLMAALLLLIIGATPAAARQDATPTSGLADLGLPGLDVTVTADAFEGIPDQLEAGRYLVTVSAAEDTEFGGGVDFIQPAGVSAEEFLAALSGPPDESGVGAAGTPMAGMAEGTPAAGGEPEGGPPAFLFESTFAGGTSAMAGQTAQVVLDLTPGEWIAWAGDPEAAQQPVVLEVTGEMPADLPEPAAGATLTMSEYAITVSEGALATGSQVVKVENIGAQPHFIFVAKVPDGLTAEQIEAVLEEERQAEMTGTPPAYSDFNPDEDAVPVGSSGTQSTGTAQWISLDLEPGTHVLICFFPDISDGVPHAYKGMYTIVEVAA